MVIVFLSGRFRHQSVSLALLRIVWASWLVSAGIAFRPYESCHFCRLQVALKSIVLYAMVWSAVLLLGAFHFGEVVRLPLTSVFLISVLPFGTLTYLLAGYIFVDDPFRPSVGRSFANLRALTQQQAVLDEEYAKAELLARRAALCHSAANNAAADNAAANSADATSEQGTPGVLLRHPIMPRHACHVTDKTTASEMEVRHSSYSAVKLDANSHIASRASRLTLHDRLDSWGAVTARFSSVSTDVTSNCSVKNVGKVLGAIGADLSV